MEHLRGVGSHAWRREASGLLFQRCRRCVGRVVGVGPSEQMKGETKWSLGQAKTDTSERIRLPHAPEEEIHEPHERELSRNQIVY